MITISFNIRCANDPDGNSIKERAERLKAVLDKYNADIIGFQEAYYKKGLRRKIRNIQPLS